MIDENAFGLLVAHYDLENVEYSLEEEAYLDYLKRFSELIDDQLSATPLATGVRELDLGHARYLEFADGDELTSPINWIRQLRTTLVDADMPNVCVLTAGGRWVKLSGSGEDSSNLPSSYGPSEPLRKALAGEASAQPTEAGDEEEVGWGPGLYIEKEAIEQSGRALKNAPTALKVHSSVFYRIGA